jgi:hypothetical protein
VAIVSPTFTMCISCLQVPIPVVVQPISPGNPTGTCTDSDTRLESDWGAPASTADAENIEEEDAECKDERGGRRTSLAQLRELVALQDIK